jgi:hypothetical protein
MWSERVSAECALSVSGIGWSRFGSTGMVIKPFWRVSLAEVYIKKILYANMVPNKK